MIFMEKLNKFIDQLRALSVPDKGYISKVILGLIASLICILLVLIQYHTGISFFAQSIGVGVGFALIPIHWLIALYVINVDLKHFGNSKFKLLTNGIGAYLFTWLIIWTTWTTLWWICVYGIPTFL